MPKLSAAARIWTPIGALAKKVVNPIMRTSVAAIVSRSSFGMLTEPTWSELDRLSEISTVLDTEPRRWSRPSAAADN